MPYSEEAGEEPGPENYNLALLQRETLARNGRLKKIDEAAEQEKKIYSEKLKEKLDSVSNPYFIAPYDSLQLYHYEVEISAFRFFLIFVFDRKSLNNKRKKICFFF